MPLYTFPQRPHEVGLCPSSPTFIDGKTEKRRTYVTCPHLQSWLLTKPRMKPKLSELEAQILDTILLIHSTPSALTSAMERTSKHECYKYKISCPPPTPVGLHKICLWSLGEKLGPKITTNQPTENRNSKATLYDIPIILVMNR